MITIGAALSAATTISPGASWQKVGLGSIDMSGARRMLFVRTWSVLDKSVSAYASVDLVEREASGQWYAYISETGGLMMSADVTVNATIAATCVDMRYAALT